jgi:hypothetical protein
MATTFFHFKKLKIMTNMREYWAREAEMMRDKSGVLGSQNVASNNTSGAWQVTKKWNDEEIKKYRNALAHLISAIEERGDTYSCEDFAINLIITFSKENNLPFKWKTGSQNFDASNSNYGDYSSFMKAVMKATGASDFQNGSNTTVVNISSVQIGDVLALITPDDKGVSHHIQVVAKTYGTPNVVLDIKQGNLSGPLFKITQKIQSGTHLLKRDEYFNKDDSKTYAPFSNSYSIQARKYNFATWNE